MTIFDQFFDNFISKNGQFSGQFGMNKTCTIKKFIKNWAKKYGPRLLALVSKIENGAWSCLSDEN